MKYLHELSRRNVTVGMFALMILGLSRPTLEQPKVHTAPSTTTTEVVGVDVSHHQGTIDWTTVKNSQQVNFAFVKVTEGVSYIDPQSTKNADALRKLAIPFGNYHFFHPNEDAERQAKFFLKHVSKPVILPPVLDVEIIQSASSTELQSKVNKWLSVVEQEIGCTPIIYTDLYFWETYLSSGFQSYPLWLAEYRAHIYVPPEMKRWSIWQRTDKGKVPGINGAVDINQLNRTETSLGNLQC